MIWISSVVFAVVFQLTTSQILGPRQYQSQMPPQLSNYGGNLIRSNCGSSINNIPSASYASSFGNLPSANIANGFGNLPNANIANGFGNYGNNHNIISASNRFSNSMMPNSLSSGYISNSNPRFSNNLPNILSVPNGVSSTTLSASPLPSALANYASVFGNNGQFSLASGSPNSPPYGLQIFSDALQVGGNVAVNGMMPISGMVGVNGQVPTDGLAAVNYGCGRDVVYV